MNLTARNRLVIENQEGFMDEEEIDRASQQLETGRADRGIA